MPFSVLDFAAVSRALARLKEREDETLDAYFEITEEIERAPEDERPALASRVEQGFTVRLQRPGRVWMASADEIDGQHFEKALRQVARVHPRSSLAVAGLNRGPIPEEDSSPLEKFPSLLAKAIRLHHVAFPYEIGIKRHRRFLQTVSDRPMPPPQSECWYSTEIQLPWGRSGSLEVDLNRESAERLAERLVSSFTYRRSNSPTPGTRRLVLSSTAAAVFLHEAVAHALEVDILASSGRPEAAIGLSLGSSDLNVIDDPQSAPSSVQRTVDDEGFATRRRWLLRAGVVEQPLCDSFWARGSDHLEAGSGRRSGRHLPVIPRCHHLELLPGDAEDSDLLSLAEGGLWFSEVSWGRLDPWTGIFELRFPWGRSIQNGRLESGVGPCRLRGRVASLLENVLALGQNSIQCGAGWCAKEVQRLPVWATTPSLALREVEIQS